MSAFTTWSASNLRIRTKTGTIAPFVLNPVQLELERVWSEQVAACKPVRIVVLKARQEGVSTWSLAHGYGHATKQRGQQAYFIAHDLESTRDLFDAVRLMYDEQVNDELRDWHPEARPATRYSTKTELDFRNPDRKATGADLGLCSRIRIGTAGRMMAGRSRTIQYLHASEVAFWQDAARVFTGLLPAVPSQPGTAVIVESTANGVGGEFYRLWQMASDPTTAGDWRAVFLPWHAFPEYVRSVQAHGWEPIPQAAASTAEWEREEDELRASLGLTDDQLNWRRWAVHHVCRDNLDNFRQEFPATPAEAFVTSGRCVFNREKVAARILHLEGEDRRRFREQAKPRFMRGELVKIAGGSIRWQDKHDGQLTVYRVPEDGSEYLAAADVAEGIEAAEGDSDYSTVQVFDRHTGEQVATWRGRLSPAEFARQVGIIGRWYKWALLIPEANNHGQTVVTLLARWNYPNLWMRQDWDGIAEKWHERYGWLTTSKTRPRAIDCLAQGFVEAHLRLNDIPTLQEMTTFVRKSKQTGGRPRIEAQTGCHDDLVMAAAIAAVIVELGPQPDAKASRIPEIDSMPAAIVRDVRQLVAQARAMTAEVA